MNEQAHTIFSDASELQPERRSEFVRERCAGDSDLEAEVRSLLQAHDDAGSFLAAPTADFVNSLKPAETKTALPEEPGTTIDRYKLLEAIGEGGFGVVYMAQQSEPVRRRVALKIIKLGMDTNQVVARFESERQALAMMDHPNIASVIDGGATESGRPYFVMELVRGESITTYCDNARLSTRDRLLLFKQVCEAIQHAHQKGIVHRDIKPSNVLVSNLDGRPLVKVIDFGIAKATNSELTGKTLFTEFHQVVGTPQYMSPEQAERTGADVDTRSDVYSLGVLLYEILTGRTPVDSKKLASAAWQELQRVICEEEPTRPSTLLSSSANLSDVARLHDTQPSNLHGMLKGDLDWIVLRALEKDRSRRYPSAIQFADDIDRFLNDDAVEATPPSVSYRFSKFARRNRGMLIGIAAVAASLVLGMITTSLMARKAIASRDIAQSAMEEARANALRARRAAVVAGGSLLMGKEETETLASQWFEDLRRRRESGEGDERALVAGEVQVASWYSSWLVREGESKRAMEIVDKVYDRASETLPESDASLLSLTNTRIQLLLQTGASQPVIASAYESLIERLVVVKGIDATTAILPEYAVALALSDQEEKALATLETYLDRKAKSGAGPTAIDRLRIERTLDQLATWGLKHPEPYGRLKQYLGAGRVEQDQVPSEKDDGLAKDLVTFQGYWRCKFYKRGKLVEDQLVRIEDDQTTSVFVDDNGKAAAVRTGRFKLGRSGAAKVFTAYLGSDPNQGASFAYTILPNRFYFMSAMLEGYPGFPDVQLREFYRIKVAVWDDLVPEDGAR